MSTEEGTSTRSKPLIGTDEATIDDKGRILVSKKKRERLGETFAIALGPTGCLEAYPQEVWDRKVDKIMGYDDLNPGAQDYSRLILGTAEDELKFDQQGRVVVPSKLRTLANLEDKVLLIGCGNRLEVWAAQEYKEFKKYGAEYEKGRREEINSAYDLMVGRC